MRTLWIVMAAAVVLAVRSFADEPALKYRVVTPKEVGINATGINSRGDIVGFEWVEDKDMPDVLYQKPFLARGKTMTYLPLLAGYTATSPAAVSDDGLVVGRASKPARPGEAVYLRNQAFVWDEHSGMHGLGVIEGDVATFACGVSRDGSRISGFSVGQGRIRACVWDRKGDGWEGVALPHMSRLGSNTVAISGDGKRVTAVDGATPCLWSRDTSGRWAREEIGKPGSLIPRAINDSGVVAGMRFDGEGVPHAVIWDRAGGCRDIKEPDGYVRSEANAVNNHGAIVGMIDGPARSKTGPNAFVYVGGKLRVIDEGGPMFDTATAINDRGDVAGVLEEKEED